MPEAKPLPPGSTGLPLLGETVSFGANPQRFVHERRRRHGDVFRTHILGAPVVVMSGPAALRFVLITHRHLFTAREGWPLGLRTLMSGSLMMRDGAEHQHARQLLAPAFFGRGLEAYIGVMEEATAHYLDRWERQGRFGWYGELKRLSFEIACRLILGASPGGDLDRLSDLFEAYCRGMHGVNPAIRLRWRWTPYGRALVAREELLRHVGGLVAERRRVPSGDALGRMVQTIDDQGGGLSAHEVAQHALFLLFAGHESTASLMTSFCLEMARHSDVLQRAIVEQERVAGDGPLTLDRVASMRYLDSIFLELERLYPPFTGAFRYVTKEFEYAGFRVPKGWKVFYAISGSHHDPQLFPEPERFMPDRFAAANVAEMRRECRLVGFGGGGRTCLGIEFARLEAKVVASHLLRSYRWEVLPGQRLDLEYIPSIRPRGGLQVAFARRQQLAAAPAAASAAG